MVLFRSQVGLRGFLRNLAAVLISLTSVHVVAGPINILSPASDLVVPETTTSQDFQIALDEEATDVTQIEWRVNGGTWQPVPGAAAGIIHEDFGPSSDFFTAAPVVAPSSVNPENHRWERAVSPTSVDNPPLPPSPSGDANLLAAEVNNLDGATQRIYQFADTESRSAYTVQTDLIGWTHEDFHNGFTTQFPGLALNMADDGSAGYLLNLRMDDSPVFGHYLSLHRLEPGQTILTATTLSRIYFRVGTAGVLSTPAGSPVIRDPQRSAFNEWIRIKAVVDGSHLKIYVDDSPEPVVDYIDTALGARTTGRVGLFIDDPYVSIVGAARVHTAFFDRFSLRTDDTYSVTAPLSLGANTFEFRAVNGTEQVGEVVARTIQREVTPIGNKIVTDYTRRFGLGTLYSVAYSPDGNFIATCGGAGAFVWDAETGEVLRELVGHASIVSSVVFSPEGSRVLTGSWDATARLWDMSTGAQVRIFSGHGGTVNSVAFSPDGTNVLTGSSDRTSRLWDTETGEVLQTFTGHISTVNSVAFSPDGTRILTGSLSFHFDGEEHSYPGEAWVWDAGTGIVLQTFIGHTNSVRSVAFSPDGTRTLTGSYDNTARLWDVNTGQELQSFAHPEVVNSVAFSPDGTDILTGSNDKTARLWDASTGAALRTLSGHTNTVAGVAYSPDGTRVLTGSRDGTARLWETSTGAVRQTFSGHTGWVYAVAYSPDGTRVLTGSNGDARLWDVNTGVVQRTLVGHSRSLTSVAFSPDGSLLLTGSDDATARLWDANSGWTLRTIRGHSGGVNAVVFSPDGSQILTGSDDNTSRLWDTSTGALLQVFTGHTNWVNSVAFSPDGSRVVTGSQDRTVRLWDATTGVNLRTFANENTYLVYSVAFSPDGTRVLTGSANGNVQLWDVESSAEPQAFRGITSSINSVAFSPDGTRILTGCWDNTARLLDSSTGAVLQTFKGHTASVESVAFSPDGSQFVTGSWDGTASLWPSGINTSRVKQKVLIVAGGGNYLGNDIADQTKALAGRAHATSTIRGIKPENILYLSAFETTVENPLVNGPATKATVQAALTDFASDARHLTVFLLDHGQYDPEQDEWYFHLDETQSPPERLSATEFDQMLDTAQTGGVVDLAVVVDMCYAGGFVRRCSGVPAGSPVGARRVVIASTTDERLANYGGGSNASLSFTGFLLQALLQGVTLQEGFDRAREAVESLRQPRLAPQSPWMDDDGDGVYTAGVDGAKAARLTLGPASPFGRQSVEEISFGLAPELLSIDSDVQVSSPQPVPLSAVVSDRPVDGVEAIVTWSGTVFEEGEPIANVGTVELTREGSTTTWSGTLPVNLLPGDGVYTITYVAYRNDLLLPSIRYTSDAKSRILQIGGTQPDIYEFPPYNDSTESGTANLLAVGVPQDHTIHVETDEDWGIVFDQTTGVYELEFSDMVVPQGTILKVFAYVDGPDVEPVVVSSSDAIAGRVVIGLQSSGEFVRYVARLCNIASPSEECIPLTSLPVGASYRVQLKFVGAGRIGAAIQIDGERMSIPIGLDGLTISNYRGARAYRSSAFGGPEVLVGGTDGLSISFPQAACDCPPDNPALGSYTSCLEIIDTVSPVPGFDFLNYRLELVRTNGATEPWEVMDATGTIIGGLDPSISPLCVSTPNVAPIITVSVPTSDQTVANAATSFNFSGTAVDNDGSVASIQWRVNSGNLQAASGTTSWSFSVPLSVGTNTVEVYAVDNEGLASATVTRIITRRAPNVAPSIAVTAPTSDQTVANAATSFNFSGTAVDNDGSVASIQWRVNSGNLQAASGTTAWSFSAPLTVGTNTVEVYAVDNEGLASATVTRIITRRAPNVAPTITVSVPTSDQTVANAATTFNFSGTASDSDGTVASIQWRVNSGNLQTASGTTSWSFSVSLDVGANTVEVYVVDNEGLASSTVTRVITRRAPNVAPGITVTAPTSDQTVAYATTSFDFSGTASDSDGSVASIQWRVNGESLQMATGTVSWSFAAPLSIGTNTVEVYAVDNEGLASSTVTRIITRRAPNVVPSITVTAPTTYQFVANAITSFDFSGTASDIDGSVASIQWRVNSGNLQTASGTTSWSFSVPLVVGTNMVEVYAVDNEGLASATVARIITRRAPNVAPSIVVFTPTTDQTVANAATTFNFSGMASDNDGSVSSIQWRVNSGSLQTITNSTAFWSFSVPLSVGTNTVEVYAVDDEGLASATVARIITRRAPNVAPSITVTAPTTDQTVANAITSFDFSGTASDSDGSVASMHWRVNSGTLQTATGTTSWSFSAPLVVGANTVEFFAVDDEGLASTVATRAILRAAAGNQPPSVSIVSPSPGTIVDNVSTLIGFVFSASDADGTVSAVEWRVNGGGFQQASAAGGGSWVAAIPVVVGVNTIEVRAVDDDGAISLVVSRTVTRRALVPDGWMFF
ncbi:hypothetical protein GC173_01025 [bacterium]|nr:hypothetical protein [bacterium]